MKKSSSRDETFLKNPFDHVGYVKWLPWHWLREEALTENMQFLEMLKWGTQEYAGKIPMLYAGLLDHVYNKQKV